MALLAADPFVNPHQGKPGPLMTALELSIINPTRSLVALLATFPQSPIMDVVMAVLALVGSSFKCQIGMAGEAPNRPVSPFQREGGSLMVKTYAILKGRPSL